MAYIGRGTDNISNVEVLDNITFSGASSYTLQKGSANYVPISAANILVSIDGVVQANNFSVNGSTIDFGVAIANTSTCNFILHYGVGLVTTVQDGAITSTKLGSSSVTSAKMASNSIATASIIDDAVNYAKIQDVSQSNRLLGAETAGTIAEVQVNTNMIADAQVDESKLKISNAPTNGYFLSAQSGGSGGMTWAEAGGTNTPSFFSYAGANFNISEASDVKMIFNTELYDEGSVYDTSNGRFTPGSLGKYYIFSSIFSFAGSDSITQRTKLYKNGSSFSISALDLDDYYLRSGYSQSQSIGLIINVTSVNDYFEIYFHGNNSGDGNITINGNSTQSQSYFGAYKLIT